MFKVVMVNFVELHRPIICETNRSSMTDLADKGQGQEETEHVLDVITGFISVFRLQYNFKMEN